jgi:cytochrome c-type biogenesis protein CcmF
MMIWPKWRVEKPVISVALHLAVAAPFVALASRFIVNDTTILHVALNGGEDLPLKYRFAATWAAREGPLLMWAAWMGLVAWWFGRPLASELEQTHHLRLRLMHGFTLLLLLISMTLDPFAENPLGLRGAGLNELLQTDLMVIHPPLVFLAYSLCIALAATSLAILQYDDDADIDKRMLHQTRPGLLIATLGIGLGGLWAYMVLDWGGYWAWDPVETGSFLPWACSRPHGSSSEHARVKHRLSCGLDLVLPQVLCIVRDLGSLVLVAFGQHPSTRFVIGIQIEHHLQMCSVG